ncbi:hypothetical protein [Protaetiibacter larvae]|nr:hypothetical protein [Protaetiibacter larvae]
MSRAVKRRTPRERRRLRTRLRLSAVAGAVALISVIGSGAAWAAWTANDSAGSTATAATVGVTHAFATTPTLPVTYNATTTVAVGTVTVTNTSSRTGSYSLVLSATSASATLRGAVAVEIGTAASCTTGATLTNSTTGTFAAPITKSGTITAGQVLTFCVRTTMTAANVTANAGASLAATVQTGVTVGTWTSNAATNLAFAQSVAAATGFVSHEANRYQIFNQGQCIGTRWNQYDDLSRGAIAGDCNNEQTSQWRLFDVAGHADTKYIARAYNTGANPGARWNVVSGTNINLTTASDVAAQRWTITQRPDGLYRFVSGFAPGTQCLQVQANNRLALATCDNALASQGFSFTLVANAAPAPVTLTCSAQNGSNWVQYSWSVLTGYQAEVSYKVYVGGIFIGDHTNGWDTKVNLYTPGGGALAIPVGTLGAGPKTLEIYQSVGGATPTLTGTATIIIAAGTNYISCG